MKPRDSDFRVRPKKSWIPDEGQLLGHFQVGYRYRSRIEGLYSTL